jgi:hypothetical protein
MPKQFLTTIQKIQDGTNCETVELIELMVFSSWMSDDGKPITASQFKAAIKYYAEELKDGSSLVVYSPNSKTQMSHIIGVPFGSMDKVAQKGWNAAMKNSSHVAISGGGLFLVTKTAKRRKKKDFTEYFIKPLIVTKPDFD